VYRWKRTPIRKRSTGRPRRRLKTTVDCLLGFWRRKEFGISSRSCQDGGPCFWRYYNIRLYCQSVSKIKISYRISKKCLCTNICYKVFLIHVVPLLILSTSSDGQGILWSSYLQLIPEKPTQTSRVSPLDDFTVHFKHVLVVLISTWVQKPDVGK
jgi:hypothetical protein